MDTFDSVFSLTHAADPWRTGRLPWHDLGALGTGLLTGVGMAEVWVLGCAKLGVSASEVAGCFVFETFALERALVAGACALWLG